MTYLVAYAVTLIVYLALDQAWLRSVLRPRLARRAGDLLLDRPRSGAAIGFGFLYAAVLTFLAAGPGLFLDSLEQPLMASGWAVTFFLGAVLGFTSYGTRAAGNMAVLRGWGWSTGLLEILWGTVVSAVAALAGYYAASTWAA